MGCKPLQNDYRLLPLKEYHTDKIEGSYMCVNVKKSPGEKRYKINERYAVMYVSLGVCNYIWILFFEKNHKNNLIIA